MTSNPSQSILDKHSLPILKIDSIESKNSQQKNEGVVIVTDESVVSKNNQPSVFTVNSVATKVKLFNVSKECRLRNKANSSILITFSSVVFNHLKSRMTRQEVQNQWRSLLNTSFTDPIQSKSHPNRSWCRLQDHKPLSLLSVPQSACIKSSRHRVLCQILRLKRTNSRHLTSWFQVQALPPTQSHSSRTFQLWMSTSFSSDQTTLLANTATVSNSSLLF